MQCSTKACSPPCLGLLECNLVIGESRLFTIERPSIPVGIVVFPTHQLSVSFARKYFSIIPTPSLSVFIEIIIENTRCGLCHSFYRFLRIFYRSFRHSVPRTTAPRIPINTALTTLSIVTTTRPQILMDRSAISIPWLIV